MTQTQRKLWLPFVLTAMVEAALLGLVWLAPHPPYSVLLAPPIRYVFGERVLHYPWHAWFLFHVMKHTHLAASTLVGAFMSGLACAMVRQAHEGRRLSLRDALVSGQARYGRILLIWLVAWAAASAASTFLPQLMPNRTAALWAGIGITVLLQALFVYAIPASVFDGTAWFRALWRGLREAARYPLGTLAVVILPSAAVIGFVLATSSRSATDWMSRAAPEFALALVAARLAVWTIADAALTVSASHLWWAHRRLERAAQSAAIAAAAPGSALTGPRPALTSVAAGILIVLAGLGSAGCSADYAGERLFWKAQQASAAILKDAAQATPEQFEAAAAAFARVASSAAGTEWAAKSHAAIGSLHALQQQYDQAREAYATVLRGYAEYPEACLGARLAIAKTFELEQRWDDAVGMYEEVADAHAWTRFGLEAPLYIGDLFRKQGLSDRAASAYARAVTTYQGRIERAPAPEAANAARGYLAAAYQRIGAWGQAADTLEALAGQPQAANRPGVLLALGSMYQSKLGKAEKARAAYAALVRDFPEHPFAKTAQAQLDRIVALGPEAETASAQLKITPVPAP
jgi:tetratricopeptide (TPR) repeat protein